MHYSRVATVRRGCQIALQVQVQCPQSHEHNYNHDQNVNVYRAIKNRHEVTLVYCTNQTKRLMGKKQKKNVINFRIGDVHRFLMSNLQPV